MRNGFYPLDYMLMGNKCANFKLRKFAYFCPADIKRVIAGRKSQVLLIAALHVETVLLCVRSVCW